jgi:hypothetical protein
VPEMVAERTVGLVSLLRERFIERITTGKRPLELCDPGRRSSSPTERASEPEERGGPVDCPRSGDALEGGENVLCGSIPRTPFR